MERKFLRSSEEKGLATKDKNLISEGVILMKNSKDPLHDLDHIITLKDNYEEFNKGGEIETNKKVMLYSIVFHDTFKAVNPRATSGIRLVWDELYEGMGSAKIFEGHAKKSELDKGLANEVIYAIRKHPLFNLFPRATKEAKLLFDLDELEFWNFNRFKKSFNVFQFDLNRHIEATLAYLKHRTNKGFYFEWSRHKFEQNKPNFIEELKKIAQLAKHGLR